MGIYVGSYVILRFDDFVEKIIKRKNEVFEEEVIEKKVKEIKKEIKEI